jgi:hypothetical protein
MLISNLLKKLLKQLCENSYQRKSDRKLSFLLFVLIPTRHRIFAMYDTHQIFSKLFFSFISTFCKL